MGRRYFERSGPSTQGRMVSDTWIGGWYVNENGVWDGKKEQDDRENPGQEELDNGSEISGKLPMSIRLRIFPKPSVRHGFTGI